MCWYWYRDPQHVRQTCSTQSVLQCSSVQRSATMHQQSPTHITTAGSTGVLEYELPVDGITATPLQHLLNQYREKPNLTVPPTHCQPTMEPALANRPTSYVNGSSFFHAQEREFLSRTTSFFQIQIDIDLPHNPQAAGGSYTPPRLIIPCNRPSPPPQQPSPSPSAPRNISISPSRRKLSMKTISIDPLSLATRPMNGSHIRQYRERGRNLQYPCPTPKLRHRSLLDVTVDADTKKRHTPYSGSKRRRAREPSGSREG